MTFPLLERLKGKTAWIIGGKRVGQKIAEELSKLGVNIFVTYRESEKEAKEIQEKAMNVGVKSFIFKADVSKKEDVEKATTEAYEKFGGVDYLINMASVFSKKRWEDVSDEDWNKNIEAHIKGSFWPAQILAKKWIEENRKGKIIFFEDRTSVEAGRPYNNFLPYIVTKGAIHSMIKTLAKELGQYGIIINGIAPGPLLKPDSMSDQEWLENRSSALLKGITDEESMNQVALTVIYFLLAELTTGQSLVLDSGFNLV